MLLQTIGREEAPVSEKPHSLELAIAATADLLSLRSRLFQEREVS